MKLLSGLICLAVAAGVVVNAIPAPQVDVTPIEELLVRDVGAGCDSGCLNDLRLCFARNVYSNTCLVKHCPRAGCQKCKRCNMIPNPDGVAPVEKRGDAVATGTNSLDDGLTQCFICKDWYYKCISDHKRMDNPVAMCKTLMCEQEPCHSCPMCHQPKGKRQDPLDDFEDVEHLLEEVEKVLEEIEDGPPNKRQEDNHKDLLDLLDVIEDIGEKIGDGPQV